jgi:hypothetical protein
MVSKKWTPKYQQDVDDLAMAQQLTSARQSVFIAFDLEWDETDPNTILEIGMAVLDLREGMLRPNRFPPNTWSIRVRHFIIRENLGIHNSRYVRSNKFRFTFGKSYITSLEKAIDAIADMLEQYGDEEVKIVGHNMSGDLNKLEEKGLDTSAYDDWFDTSNLERAYSRRVNGRKYKLGKVCEDLDIRYYRENKLHNAGNDAFFTMAIFAQMCCVEGEE